MPRCLQLGAALLVALSACAVSAQEIVLTFGGDVNFARSRETPLPDRVRKFGTHRLTDLTELLATEWDGDINFVNVETVVAERDGARQGKTFVFRSHPDQFRHLIRLGVNAFGLANNHAFDHGRSGLSATLDFFDGEDRPTRPLLYAGIGRGEDAFAPKIATVKGVRVAMSSLSFGSGSYAPREDRVGMAYLFSRGHYDKVLAGLKSAKADLKILSVHYGTENATSLNSGQAALFRRAVDEAGVHLVLGHHPHVVRAVEAIPEKSAAIFYSLGNFLFIGGAGKDGAGLGSDYGLMGKAYFSITDGAAHLNALEAVPLKGVHLKPRRPPASRAAATIRHLNRLSRSSVGDRAAAFAVTRPEAPRGLMCFGGPYPPRARAQYCRIERSLECDLPDLM
ncbi:putative enzyme of poly-gamma-glutamate biosynthesis (capsule formation) [Candidatus Rhodobacter oscarellae]|uniref:Putative enzyme of poly-gamma-glutamate biosynthesis (Capsule formation) n=1 Tax=Candidatus Rhodobacter oscarellae TaxID=1675527 RepID=A0A0J9E5B0_9RHOB|nr:CapA family protein [Candidatus Rhodobacter lobularis]KMW57942.1 putative enzyme of poly-gamma-glutamate biosynthesis (capsule formation) [Candidatus Rhodobacter lobularis]